MKRLGPLCEVLALDKNQVVTTLRDLVAPWEVRATPHSSWLSEISDDNTPIELSVSLSHHPAALRVLFEPQGEESSLRSFRASGLAFQNRLESEFGADLSRFRRVQDLFLPENMQGRFAVWSSVVFTRDECPSFKAYLNPNAQGRGVAPSLVEQALGRLGFHHAWTSLCEGALRRGPHLDEVKYFALDLTPRADARVKVYVHHHRATAKDLEAASENSDCYERGKALAFARAMRGGDELMAARAPFTCHSFSREHPQRALTTVYIPACAYARDDATVYRRVISYLTENGIDPTLYRRIVVDAAPRPLETGVGMQAWIALRGERGGSRITVYLATEARHVYAPGSVPAPTADPLLFDSPEGTLDLLAERPLDAHPYMRRLASPLSVGLAWLLVRTLHEAISVQLANGTKAITDHVEDAIRALVSNFAEQLDALQSAGADDLAQVEAMQTTEPPGLTLATCHGLRAALAAHCESEDVYEALAAILAGEVAVRQLGGAISRRTESAQTDDASASQGECGVPTRDTPEEVYTIARFVPRTLDVTASFARGIAGLHCAVWRALDEMYGAVFAGAE